MSMEQFTFGPAEKQIADFTGATSSSAGERGLVPAPSSGDGSKFLKGDGTWGDTSAELAGKTDKVTSATSGNFAGLDGNGNLTDSGKTTTDFIASTLKGAANGVAELDSTGKVPSNQLPAFVDNVLEYPTVGDFPLTGESGKVYIATDTGITYRWSGSTYVPIRGDLALGETSSTAYRGDRGKTAYDHASDGARLTTAQVSGLYKVSVTAEGHVGSATAVQKSDITGLGIPGQDTTYSNFTGATASAAGAAGLVPAPAAGGQDKYLKASGEWDTITSYTRQFWDNQTTASVALAANGKTTLIWCAGSSAGTAGAMMDSTHGAVILVSNGQYAVIHKGSDITISAGNGTLTVSATSGIKMATVEL